MTPQLDFLVIGTQKSAMSWLYSCLREHPEVYLPSRKREVECLGGDLYEARGADWYFGLVDGQCPGQVAGDVSVEYLYDPRAPVAVRRHVPDVKLIVSLREPIDRALSAYFWTVRKGRLPLKRVDAALRSALNADGRTPMGELYRELIDRGRYDEQLARYLQRFPAERILFIAYDDIRRTPRSVLRRLYRFLGVNSRSEPRKIRRRPKRNAYRPALIRFERRFGRSRNMRRVADVLNDLAVRVGMGRRRPTVTENVRRELAAVFRPSMQRTRAMVSRVPPARQPQMSDVFDRWLRGYR